MDIPWSSLIDFNKYCWVDYRYIFGKFCEVPINEALITDVPPSSDAKLPNQHENERSHRPPVLTNITALQHHGSHDSDESVTGLDLVEPLSTTKMGEGPTSIFCIKVKTTSNSDICKLSNCDVDCASSLENEVQVIIKEVDCKDVDISPLRKLMHDFFDPTTSYDQARSMLHDMNEEAARKELFFIAGEVLSNTMLEKDKKVREASSIRQSLQHMNKKIKELCRKVQALKSLLAEAENEAKDAKLEGSVAAKEFDTRFDTDLSNGIEQNKERLEAMRQDLINYKLCLD
ncbi:hypothetical protein T459_27739 [Capsicum annuum]|uniref:Uncharacterized protein n=1 Tax=Capsicum annuum TaxID=4072 RepID=A0A2G2YES4_CAPAN|nr:hypothetical protein T459_27739 [Capsicum annuum]